jgi:cholesterol oxidase
MEQLNRRQILTGLAAGAGGALAAKSAAAKSLAASNPTGSTSKYYKTLPSLWNVTAPPTFVPNLVIGSGFGGSISALRLAQAGEQVAILEKGFKWPTGPWNNTFSNDFTPDGRAFWYRTSAKMIAGDTTRFDSFGGIVDVSEFPNMTAWHGACVGGGSMVFTGCMIQPDQTYFDQLFNGLVSYDDLNTTYYPRVRQMLNLSTMPTDIYKSSSFGHSRIWDKDVTAAGYSITPCQSIFNYDVVRAEVHNQSRASATIALSNHGNSNGAKFDLNQNYLKYAQATGNATVYPGFEVQTITTSGNQFVVTGFLRTPDNKVLSTNTITCNRLFMAAGSIGTTTLMVKAQALGLLPNLNSAVGQGWGSNGDVLVVRSSAGLKGLTQGTPCASRIHDPTTGSLPVTLENWYVPGVPVNLGIVASLGMVFDPVNRGNFTYNAAKDSATLNWAADGNAEALASCKLVNNKIAYYSKTAPGAEPWIPDVSGLNWTAHPLGGMVIGQATDNYGRVEGYKGLYVMDGALMPGSTGAVNPSLTISAIAERNIEAIIAAGY